MIVYPAIDLRHGRCVRLVQGEASRERVYARDPVEVARLWEDQGAQWLHVVNLDGALGDEAAANLESLARILEAVNVPVQFGGGLRGLDDMQRALDAGVARVILGTVAVREPALVQKALTRFNPECIAVGIDARDGRVATHGWREVSDISALDLALQMRSVGVQRIIYTDIQRDGMLVGANAEATRRLAERAGLAVIASGGVGSLADIRTLMDLGEGHIEGVVVGMALYERRFTLAEAIAEARSTDSVE